MDDKEAIQAMCVKILNELGNAGGFNELVQKGLKSMTHKQFIGILQHFLKPIVGKTPNDFSATYADCVHQWLIQLEYPYSIAKSSLKTPNALHCINSIIVLLSWLQDFSDLDQEPLQYVPSEENPSDEMATDIMKRIGNMFVAWNNNQIEVDQAVDDITAHYRGLHAGAANLTVDCGSLQEEIRQLSGQYDEMRSHEQELSSHHKIVQEMKKKMDESNEELESKRSIEKAAREKLKRLQVQLSSQRLTVEARHQLLLEIANYKSAIASKNNAIMELREASSEKEVSLSNLISKKFQLIDRLNNMVYKLSSDLEIAGIPKNFDPAELAIKSLKDDAELDNMLEHLHGGLSSIKERHLKMVAFIKEKVLALRGEFNQLSTENELRLSKLNQLMSTLEQLTKEEQNLEMLYKSYIHNTETEHRNYVGRIEKAERDLEERTKGIDEMKQQLEDLKEKKAAFSAKATTECDRLYEERKQEIEEHRKYLNENMALIDEYNKNKKPLPENLQKVLDRLLKEKAEKENRENAPEQ